MAKIQLLSHRGNVFRRQEERENTRAYIDEAIYSGYLVEVDLHYLDNKFYLGHDGPSYEVSEDWLYDRREWLYCHAKDISSAYQLSMLSSEFNFFCHDSDTHVLTSNGLIWLHQHNVPKLAGFELNNKCIVPLLTEENIKNFDFKNKVWGICTDYVKIVEVLI